MAKKPKKGTSKNKVIEFVLDELEPVSSSGGLNTAPAEKDVPNEPEEEKAPESSFLASRELELPKLPVLEKQDRARLQVQSPNRVFFYWSLKANPYHTLSRTLATETADYTLVLRLLDTQTEREEIHPVEPEGSHWFNTDAGRTYRAEIGFYSPSRPFVRILFSNTVTTPRKSPSPRAATQSEWRVTSHKFAEVLDVSGFEKDAFDVAIVGDDAASADILTHSAFARLVGNSEYVRDEVSAEEIRFAMAAISSGHTLEELRWKIGASLFAVLQANAERLASEKAAAALSEYFDIDQAEFEEAEFAPSVGGSLVHFPRKYYTAYSPLSSHSTP